MGIGRHDVAVPVSQIENHAGKLVIPGANPDKIKAMPQFGYASDTGKRDHFVAAADKDIMSGKAKINVQISFLKMDVRAAEAKLNDMKQASAARWREFEFDVNAATARLRKSIDSATA